MTPPFSTTVAAPEHLSNIRLLTISDAEALRVSRHTLERWRSAGLIRKFKKGQVVRVSPAELDSLAPRHLRDGLTEPQPTKPDRRSLKRPEPVHVA